MFFNDSISGIFKTVYLIEMNSEQFLNGQIEKTKFKWMLNFGTPYTVKKRYFGPKLLSGIIICANPFVWLADLHLLP